MALFYRDQTYCISDCTNKECFRFVSNDTLEKSVAHGLPIAYADYSKNCEEYTND